MKKTKLLVIPVLVLLSLNFTGCIGVNRNFQKIRSHLTNNMDAGFEKKFEFSIGSAGLMLAGMVIRLTDVEEPIDEILSRISNVQVGIYERDHLGSLNANYEDLTRLTDLMEEQGWKYIVRSVQHDELVGVFVKDGDEFNDLYVISVNDDEMVMAEIHGDLAEVIEIAIREKGLDFEMVSD